MCDGCVVSVSPVILSKAPSFRCRHDLPSSLWVGGPAELQSGSVLFGPYGFRYGVHDYDTSRLQQLASGLVGLRGVVRHARRLGRSRTVVLLRGSKVTLTPPFSFWAGRGMEQPPSEGDKTEVGMCVCAAHRPFIARARQEAPCFFAENYRSKVSRGKKTERQNRGKQTRTTTNIIFSASRRETQPQ